MDRKALHLNFWYVVVAIIGIFILRDLWLQREHFQTIPYSEFESLLAEGKVAEVAVREEVLTGTFKDKKDGQEMHFVTVPVRSDLAQILSKYDVKFYGERQSGLIKSLIGWILPTLLFVLIWVFVIRRMGGMGMGGDGLMAVGKSKAKIYVEKDTKVTFADVAGVDEAKAELQEIIDFLKNPGQYGKLGARLPKGILLVGPPGTGKTLLARAVAGEAGVPFFSISGSEFVEMFVGVGAARVRDLFEQARKQAPCIIFIDELDALGRARGTFMLGGHDEKEQTLNQLLAELDGFDSSSGIVLLSATNRPEILDAALLRAGRFDRQVLVDRPDKSGRISILQVHLRKVKIDLDVNVEQVAALTPGFTGADLANLVNEAALLATRRGAKTVTLEDFTQAIERIIAGLEKRNRLINPRERAVIAHHELGHALVAMALPGSDPIQKISIIPRGISALGYTIQRPTEDRFLMTSEELEDRLAVLLGGRAAESVFFEHVSTGAADDLSKATGIARSMVARFGMNKALGQVSYEPEAAPFLTTPGQSPWQPRWYSDETAAKIDSAVRSIVEAAFDRAVLILARNKKVLSEAALNLLKQETFGPSDIEALRRKVSSASEALDQGVRGA
ncbi:MAG: ATP-dependent zinc metalloprotease FtsH [Alphaproteobacteria bacterium]